MDPFNLIKATSAEIPIIISVPHCGTMFPEEITSQYKAELIGAPDDTDWVVDQLYDFAPAMGITMITAYYSRWVIDLNRDRDSKPLYNDGRIITGLCPTKTFLGEPLYNDEREKIEQAEIDRRINLYYDPYHSKIQGLINNLKSKFGTVLLWDCHSIRQVVPTIQKDKFPDLILGSADQKSADQNLIDVALKTLSSEKYSLNHNHPFKGGTITRTFGKPAMNQHALQLEMSKVNYMDDAETKYDQGRANKIQELLKRTFAALGETLKNLGEKN
jgi:N-formylglutamate deformylase